MRKKYLNNSKQAIIDKAFREKEDNVTLCGEEYHIYSPNYDGGNIEGNCDILDVEFQIIDSFDKGYLNSLEKDLDYLKKLIAHRKSELSPKVTRHSLYEKRYKSGNTKLCELSVIRYEYVEDIYGDNEITNRESIENYLYSDTKRYQEEIQERIADIRKIYKL